ncbi:hypothetical protein SPRG_04652 [Saprolegnia parasitica CBS 223.65]|uniref:PIG-P domain-containing protein n=1 Tax=Saprolegnia parasitica (strain CBS 223.65) TaxID=695850 RepID=A0A067CW67_SAPPC|nr:hypothetical protein SPRG_04652 [Saprolegnia parasitica CBS 223.65]KDO30751.1 hypothetical protein SPRG_04652 [Saprolegnia parasitica CBS 223.65]|eukprot:XP_012198451.1 hypothetical protein SPRG_04652 [Saprolegnia parasitica CBS 223.65]
MVRRKVSSSVDARKTDRRFSDFPEGVAMPPSMSFLETQRINAMQMEIYGFAGWIASIVVFACYLLWAYLPDSVLNQYGISYYPSRYWAVALPAMLCMSIFMVLIIYVAINLLSTAPLDSYNTIRGISYNDCTWKLTLSTDKYTVTMADEDIQAQASVNTPAFTDIPLTSINRVLFS